MFTRDTDYTPDFYKENNLANIIFQNIEPTDVPKVNDKKFLLCQGWEPLIQEQNQSWKVISSPEQVTAYAWVPILAKFENDSLIPETPCTFIVFIIMPSAKCPGQPRLGVISHSLNHVTLIKPQ